MGSPGFLPVNFEDEWAKTQPNLHNPQPNPYIPPVTSNPWLSGSSPTTSSGTSPATAVANAQPPASGGGSPLPPSSTVPASTTPTQTIPGTGGTSEIPAIPPVSPPGAGAATGGQTSNERTITVNGRTYTIQTGGNPMVNPTEGDIEDTHADTPALAYSPEDPMLGVVREQLLALMNRANQTPTLEDPTLKAQADPYAVEQERARREMMADLAESASAKGIGSSGAMDVARQQSWEKLAQGIGKFNSELIGKEVTARRGDLTDALEMANTLGMFKEKTALERDLATLDTQTKVAIANLNADLETAVKNGIISSEERIAYMNNELKKYGIDTEGNIGLLNTVLKNEFDYADMNLRGQIANLDAGTKAGLATLDAKLRREGYSTQARLAAIDAAVREKGIDTQGDLGRLDAAIRKELGIGQLNLGLLNAAMGNRQFYDQIGWDMGRWAADRNAQIADMT